MNLMPFDIDTGLADIGYESARFTGSLRAPGIWGNGSAVDEVRQNIIDQGWGLSAFSMTPAGFASNFWNFSFTISAFCGDDKNRIANAIKAIFESLGFYEVSIQFRSSSGCPAPAPQQIVPTSTISRPGAVRTQSRIQPDSTSADPSYLYQAGSPATADVPIPDTTNPNGWLIWAAVGVLVLLVLRE
jgi:hypothetical protein